MGSSLYKQIEHCKKVYYTPLTEDILNDFLNGLSKENMTKRKNKRPVVDNVLPEELVKSVFEIYRPNKFQLFIMKHLGLNSWFTGNKERVTVLADILKKSVGEIYELEIKYYLS